MSVNPLNCSLTYTIGGTANVTTINVASFCTPDPAGNEQALQAGVGSLILGVCQEDGYLPPTNPTSAPLAGICGGLGDAGTVRLYVPLSKARVTTGAVAYAAGVFLTSDANGFAITALPGQPIGAYAWRASAAGEVSEVMTLPIGMVAPPVTTSTGTVITTAVSVTVLPGQAGSTFVFTAADKVATLPNVASVPPGAVFRFIALTANAAGSTGLLVKLSPADITAANVGTYASGKTYTAGDGLCNTAGTATQGDSVEFRSIGGNWHAVVTGGTWAIHA